MGDLLVTDDIETILNKKRCIACQRQYSEQTVTCPVDGQPLAPMVKDPLIGTKLADHYEIISVIGYGGMGVVYKAKHLMIGRFVAIKVLLTQLARDANAVKRFQQEAKAASRISHPGVIGIHDFGIAPTGQPFIVMDYLSGQGLDVVIKKEGKVGVERTLRIFSQACDALEHAHAQGIVHRDLKPSNIMLCEFDGEKDCVKVLDFGVAKLMPMSGEEAQRLTQTGEVCGSPVYMSPEQCVGQELDARSDIYSMGVVIYETLTGKLPILGKTMVDTMSKHISDKPEHFSVVRPDLYIPERLEQVVMRALSKEPEKRQQSMAQLKQELLMAIPQPSKSSSLRVLVPKKPIQLREKPKVARPSSLQLGLLALVVVGVPAAIALWINISPKSPSQTVLPPQPGNKTAQDTALIAPTKLPLLPAQVIPQPVNNAKAPDVVPGNSLKTKHQQHKHAPHKSVQPQKTIQAMKRPTATLKGKEPSQPSTNVWDKLRKSRSYSE